MFALSPRSQCSPGSLTWLRSSEKEVAGDVGDQRCWSVPTPHPSLPLVNQSFQGDGAWETW